MRKSTGALIAIGTPLATVAALMLLIVFVLSPDPATAACATTRTTTVDPDEIPDGPVAGYTGPQLTNAAHIMNAAATLNLSQAAQTLGVMTAMGESSLIVLDHGDTAGPDSRGLFQQRDNGAWGTYQDRMDPRVSASNFFTALRTVDGWEELPPSIAAHRVQGNADPFHYEDYYPAAVAVTDALTGTTSPCPSGTLALPLDAGFAMTGNYGPRAQPTAGASTWHPAVDLQRWPNPCGNPVYAITGGTVTLHAGIQLSIKHPDGYTVSYLHMYPQDVLVQVGDTITTGQRIGAVGNAPPSTGCHLDLRINLTGNTNTALNTLVRSETQGSPTTGFVNPERFYERFGSELCPTDHCGRTY